ncbi:HAMP domain-containing sensor histidine kinase [Flavobacterium sp.]|uniref:sensor histidine kinase n=1 Tax=Flavobacterium sp. TaxID=239 RepID=UPI001210EA56|nr:HAMP domain-containing sensor histidine kinase [Flavobacterium sp.]RZJ72721.1 MAG: HAMP domain-containing histidine kinase [Flavobacterium sp.]
MISSFRNRIAFYILSATAAIVLIAFVLIYRMTVSNALSDINKDLMIEVERHQSDIEKLVDTTRLVLPNEWEESEHKDLLINPIFVQVYDKSGNFQEKSPNLKDNQLRFYKNDSERFRDTVLSGRQVRQTQSALYHSGKKVGYVVIAMSTEASFNLISDLKFLLFVLYPIILLALFFVSRFLAGKSIDPVLEIIATTERISEGNLTERILLPKRKDELYKLSVSLNSLLERVEAMMAREKEFTANASHELRTPLAVVKGTLEVLIRKPREVEQYEDKVSYCLKEIDRLTNLVEQLLDLARFENRKQDLKIVEVAIDEVVLEALQLYSEQIQIQKLLVDFTFDRHFFVQSDASMASTVISNVLSNAIKYSKPGGLLKITLTQADDTTILEVSDDGIGISETELKRIFEPFYRAGDESRSGIGGTGLGLSLVKRVCDLLKIKLQINSAIDVGTNVILTFAPH